MNEYSRILIERYCRENPKTKKARFLGDMVEMSYDVCCLPSDSDLLYLAQLISRERNPELKEALQDLDDFMCGY